MEHPDTALVPLEAHDAVLDLDLIPVSTPPARTPAAIYLAGLTPNSKRAMRAALNRVAGEISGWIGDGRDRRPRIALDEIPWAELKFQHVAALRARLAEHYSPSSANQSLVSVREVVKTAWKLGLVDGDDYRKVIDVKSIKGTRLPRGRALSPAEFRALVRVCLDGSVIGHRDAALVGTLYAGGLRRAEAVGLDLDSWNADTHELRVLHGKGGKQRLVFVGNGAALALRDWIEIRGSEPGPLFLPITRHGKIVPSRMKAAAKAAKVKKRVYVHTMRHSFATHLVQNGADIVTVQKLLGHANPATTSSIYTRVAPVDLKRAHEKTHPREKEKL